MIVFGTKDLTFVSGRGSFHCPRCLVNRDYRVRRVTRFFTLWFLPLIPFSRIAEYVECQNCKGTFRTEILQVGSQSGELLQEAIFQQALRRVLIKLMLADGQISQAELETIRQIHESIAGCSLDAPTMESEIEDVRQKNDSVSEYLATVSPLLNNNGKEWIIKAVFLVLTADGTVGDAEKQLLIETAQALEMSPAHVNGVIASVTDDPSYYKALRRLSW